MARRVTRKRRKRSKVKRSLYKKRRTKRRRRRKTKKRGSRKMRRRRRRRKQSGGSRCNSPFVGKHLPRVPGSGRLPLPQSSHDLVGSSYGGKRTGIYPKGGQKGGGNIWQNLGFTIPKEFYNDSKTFLKNIKNTYVGDKQLSTSDVLKQPIANQVSPNHVPTDYSAAFEKADTTVAETLKLPNN